MNGVQDTNDSQGTGLPPDADLVQETSVPQDVSFDGKTAAARLPRGPGVYTLRDAAANPLYVGKAANLRKRVASYFDGRPKGERHMRMLARVQAIEVALTRTEGEALLLENELIKSLKPRYNVLLRDDKSYPWLVFTTDHEFPRIAFHRGQVDKRKTCLGPFPSAWSVRESINLIQKTFRVRNCEDSYFAHRSRPCLQYQIHRCTAPCVGLVGAEAYAQQVQDALLFLRGDSQQVITRLIARMEAAAGQQEYEAAAVLRDQINILKQMQSQQFVSASGGDIDVVAVAMAEGRACVQVLSFRGGRNLGHSSHFPVHVAEHTEAEIMQAFLGQYYADRQPPPELLLSVTVADQELLAEVFSERLGRRVSLQSRPRGERRQWLEFGRRNATETLRLELAGDARMVERMAALQELLSLEQAPEWLECFDISHTAGNQTVGSCVTFDAQGPVKSGYRRFNLKDITPGDDYAAMRQVLARRYRKLAEGEGRVPSLVVVDGGAGQVRQAVEILTELGLQGLPVMGVAKGAARRAGFEEWILPDRAQPIYPGPDSPASHLIQQLRDEAHRFAITGHRGRRQKAAVDSTLETIPGVGANRRRSLLAHFGGLKGVRQAGVEELASVPGISRTLAQRIYAALH